MKHQINHYSQPINISSFNSRGGRGRGDTATTAPEIEDGGQYSLADLEKLLEANPETILFQGTGATLPFAIKEDGVKGSLICLVTVSPEDETKPYLLVEKDKWNSKGERTDEKYHQPRVDVQFDQVLEKANENDGYTGKADDYFSIRLNAAFYKEVKKDVQLKIRVQALPNGVLFTNILGIEK